ncbi:MAG: class I SAM-dependent methyltransferase [Elusimicrobiota bacterium]|jgi:SAM-dependent methyltransferase
MTPDPRIESVPCDLCGADDAPVLHAAMDGWPADAAGHFAATTDVFGAYGTIRRCRRCGLAYTSPRLKASALLDGYANAPDEEYRLEGDARSMNAYLSLAVLRRFAKGGRLLEVGSSAGFFLNAARLSYEVTGVEPSEWARDYSVKRLHLPVVARTMDEARFPDGHFDAAALIDVIEHLADPLAALRELARVLRPGGHLYLVTPDIGSLSARLLRGRWWGLRPAHIYYFDRKTMTAMLEKAGFEVALVKSYGRIFTWGYWLSRLENYPRPVYKAVEALIGLMGFEDKFLYLDTRDSIQVVARKR